MSWKNLFDNKSKEIDEKINQRKNFIAGVKKVSKEFANNIDEANAQLKKYNLYLEQGSIFQYKNEAPSTNETYSLRRMDEHNSYTKVVFFLNFYENSKPNYSYNFQSIWSDNLSFSESFKSFDLMFEDFIKKRLEELVLDAKELKKV